MSQDYTLELLSTCPTLRARAIFPSTHPAFDGHFPSSAGGPILPGFMHIQITLDILALANQPAELETITDARFTIAILSDQSIDIELIPTSLNEFDATLTLADQPASRFHLRTK
jgi:hypothetical protein